MTQFTGHGTLTINFSARVTEETKKEAMNLLTYMFAATKSINGDICFANGREMPIIATDFKIDIYDVTSDDEL